MLHSALMNPCGCVTRIMEKCMVRHAALIGSVLAGLSDAHHPLGNCVYAVRDGSAFLYIGFTVNGVWRRIRAHRSAHSPLGTAMQTHWPAAALWRVEVCNFRTESGADIVERELIRRYRPQINWVYNTGRPRTDLDDVQLRNPINGPACLWVIATGWPPFDDVVLESLENQPPRSGRSQRKPQRIVPTAEFATQIAQAGLSKSALLRESDLSPGLIYRMLNPARFGGTGSVQATSAEAMARVYATHAGVDPETAFTTLFQYADALPVRPQRVIRRAYRVGTGR
jgi:hypothetical protein